MRLALLFLVFGINSLSGQYLFEGQVSEAYSGKKVYLSLVEDYRKTSRVYLDQIVQSVQADSAGYFIFSGNQLPQANRIYRIHVDGCTEEASNRNHFLRDCNTTESLLFIANNQDTIAMPLGDYHQSFCQLVSTNPNSKALFEIEALKDEMILDFMDYDTSLGKELLYKKWFKNFKAATTDYSEPLVGLYGYAFLSDRSSETYEYYMNHDKNDGFYTTMLAQLKEKYPNSGYTTQYKKERAADQTTTASLTGNGQKLPWYGLALIGLLGVVGMVYWKVKKRNNFVRPKYADVLTPQEQRIAKLITEGKSNKEIASELFISLSTVKTHINNIYKKLGVGSRSELRIKK